MTSLFLANIAPIAGEVVYPAAAALGGAVVALYRRLNAVTDRAREDNIKAIVAINDSTNAAKELLRRWDEKERG